MTGAALKNSSENPVSAGKSGCGFFHSLYFRETVIFLLSFIFFGYFSLLGIDPHHDGVMLIPAIRVAEGQVVFRDVFCQYGLLVPLIQGAAVALFGAELLVIRILTVLFYAGSAVLLDLLWRRFLPEKVSFLTPVMFALFSACTMVTFHSWNSVYALFFMLLYGLFILRWCEGDFSCRRNLFLAGVSAALTWACRTPCGVVTLFAGILTVGGLNCFCGKSWRQVLRENLIFFAGVLSIALLAAGYILISGGWDDFIKQSFGYVTDFVYGRGDSGSWQYFCDSLFPFYQQELWFCNSFFAVLPIGAMILLYLEGRKGVLGSAEDMRKIMPLAALLILGLGSWHQYYPVPCVRHLFWGGAPLFGAFLLILCRLWGKRNFAGIAAAALLILIALLGFFPRAWGIWARVDLLSHRSVSDVQGIRYLLLNDFESQIVKMIKIGDELGKSRGGIANWSDDSLFSAMVKSSGFKDRQFYRMDTRQYPGYDARVMRHILEKRPVVLVDHDSFIPGYREAASVVYLGKKYALLIPSE